MSQPRIAIIDYGMGNLRSVAKAFEYIGATTIITSNADELDNATHIVLPGVGAFKKAIELLNNSGIAQRLLDNISNGKPMLGICLGMQMLFERSYEDGVHKGLGVLKGDVCRFDIGLKVPHIGWNAVNPILTSNSKYSALYNGIVDKNFYFVHSYYLDKGNIYANAITDYGIEFASSVEHNNIYGVQFHPEKSGDTGLKMLRNFVKINK